MGSDTYRYVANYECENCGHARTMKMRQKIGSFTEKCGGCGEEAKFELTMEPMDIDRFGEGLISR